MKRWSLILVLLAGCSHGVTPLPPPTAPPLAKWTGTGNSILPFCSATVTKGCLTTYTITQDGVIVAENIPGASLSYTLSTLPPAGEHTYQLVINGADQSGNVIQSPPATATATIP